MNSVNVVGRLTRDPEVQTISGDTVLATMSLAVPEFVNGEKTASFVTVKAWNKNATVIQQFCKKGNEVAISGRFKQERWEKEGEKRSQIVFIANTVTLVGSKNTDPGAIDETELDRMFT